MDRAALRTELERLHHESFGWAMGCCGHDPARAEDVLQTVYLKVLEGRARYGAQSAFRTWLFAVIRNTARDADRRVQRRLRWRTTADPAEVASADALPDADVHARREADRLRVLLGRLPARQREVLLLTFYHGCTLREAALVMDVSLGSARQHYHRGKQRLRQWLDDDAQRDDARRPDPDRPLSDAPSRR